MNGGTIDTDGYSRRMRARIVRPETKQLLIARLRGSDQEPDLSEPPNCEGLGRIRHFRRKTSDGWPANPLPIDPASVRLGLEPRSVMEAQVFQNAGCNWRCWYCFVPFNLLAGREDLGEWLTADDLVDLYLRERHRSPIVDLSGGQPDLVPEWIPWTMRALRKRQLEESTFLWSDDNLSNDFYFRILTEEDRETVVTYRNYARVGCFKGFNPTSFAFNTRAAPELYDRQFDLFERLLREGLELYAYVTLTSPETKGIPDDVARFVDRLQAVHENLPLRTVPLEIQVFHPVVERMGQVHHDACRNQNLARDAWITEIEERFGSSDRQQRITDIPMHFS